jgi:hypothetical protein
LPSRINLTNITWWRVWILLATFKWAWI